LLRRSAPRSHAATALSNSAIRPPMCWPSFIIEPRMFRQRIILAQLAQHPLCDVGVAPWGPSGCCLLGSRLPRHHAALWSGLRCLRQRQDGPQGERGAVPAACVDRGCLHHQQRGCDAGHVDQVSSPSLARH
jgi:hypothetical protein